MAKKRKDKKFSKTKLRPKNRTRDAVNKMQGKLTATDLNPASDAAKKAFSDTAADANAAVPPKMKAVRYAVFPKGVGVVYLRPGDNAKERVMQIDFTKTPPKGQTELNDSLRAIIEKDEASLGGAGDPPKVIAVTANKNDEDAVTAQLMQMVDDMNEEARGDKTKPQYSVQLLSSSLAVAGKKQVKLRYELTPVAADAPPPASPVMSSAELRAGLGKDNKLTGSKQYKDMLAALDAYHAHLNAYQQSLDNNSETADQLKTADDLKKDLLAAVNAYLLKHPKDKGGKKNAPERLADQLNAADPFSEATQKATEKRNPPRKIFINGKEINKAEGGQSKQLHDYIDHHLGKQVKDIWFNSIDELNNWMKSNRKLEGIGIWNGRWMNFNGKGPVVFGEEHNEVRMDFIKALNINHFVVEGAFERSLTGVADTDIPVNSTDPNSHKKYSGDSTGKALENFWVRSAQSMARFFIAFENVKNIRPQNELMDRLGELEEIMRTIEGVKPDSQNKTGIEKEINDELAAAKTFLEDARKGDLQEVLNVMKEYVENTKKDKETSKYSYGRKYEIDMEKTLSRANALLLHNSFSKFRKSIENIGYLHFKANATPEELAADDLTKNSKDPFEVWGGRRELFMLKNLEEALGKNPPPLITTMGNAHAKHQKDRLEALLKQHSGRLVIGDITALADVGAERK